MRGGESAETPQHQEQSVLITGVTPLGGGAYTVTISPGIYAPNWTSSQSPTASFPGTVYYGVGLEDITIHTDPTLTSASSGVNVGYCYGCWIKGVRFIGAAQNNVFNVAGFAKNTLVMNNYCHPRVVLDGNYPNCEEDSSDSDTLYLNNIVDNGPGYDGLGKSSGDVVAYSYHIWTFTNQETTPLLQHEPGNMYVLYEGNIDGGTTEDDTHGSHALSTWFRSYESGYYQPYQSNPNKYITNLGQGNRFTNFVGDIRGSSYITTYQLLFTNAFNCNFCFVPASSVFNDTLVQSTSFRWGNYDVSSATLNFCGPGASGFTSCPGYGTASSLSASESGTAVTVTSTLNPSLHATVVMTGCSVTGYNGTFVVTSSSNSTSFQYGLYASGLGSATGCTATLGSEVPTVLAGNASGLANSTPSSTALPPSFFLPTTVHPSGGTGLSWWKVCTAWTTFPTVCSTSSTPPFPPIGPDVVGGNAPASSFGSSPGVNGYVYDTPASIAFLNLPIDTTYQSTYCIASSSWSGGTESLNLGTNGSCAGGALTAFGDVTHVIGGMQITAGNCGTTGAGTSTGSEVFIINTNSTTQIQYSLASNPGSCAGENILFPDVRQFDERVYQNDPIGPGLPAPIHIPMFYALAVNP